MLGTDAFYYPMIGLAFVCMVILAVWRAGEVGLSRWKIALTCGVALLAGIVGSRIGYVMVDWNYYRLHPAQIPRFDLGGMVFYTGWFLGTLGILATIRLFQLPLWKTIDLIIPPGAFAQGVGRIGCFLTGCCAGSPTSLPWGVVFPPETIRRHPTQLYESAGVFLLFFLLKRIERRNPPPGAVFYYTLLYYGLLRFILEFIRGDARPGPFGLSIAQWISLALVVWGAMKLRRLSLLRKA